MLASSRVAPKKEGVDAVNKLASVVLLLFLIHTFKGEMSVCRNLGHCRFFLEKLLYTVCIERSPRRAL